MGSPKGLFVYETHRLEVGAKADGEVGAFSKGTPSLFWKGLEEVRILGLSSLNADMILIFHFNRISTGF